MSKVVSDINHEAYVITSYHDGKKGGFVCTWIMPASLAQIKPKLVLVVSKFNTTLPIIEKSRRLTINLLAHNQLEEFFIFGTKASDSYDKFAGVFHEITSHGLVLKNSAGFIDCVVENMYDTPDRKILFCEVVREERFDIKELTLSEALSRLNPHQKKIVEEQMASHIRRDDSENLKLL